jgi:NAD(P)-dependent dehydrogenase (short-subunit alcohol dehydrogenase family)
MKLENTVALVTGANRGIGRALVNALVERGTKKVYAAARDVKSLDPMLRAHPSVVPLRLDTTDAAQLAALVEQTRDVNLLINNAGVLASGSLLDTPMTAIEKDLGTNYLGTLNVIRALAPTLVTNKGALANLLTVVSLASMPALGGYSASKAAAWSMTQGLRGELGKKGVKVFGVFPGPIDTQMSKDITLPKTSAAETAKAIVDGVIAGTLDIYPDPMSKQVGAAFATSPAEVAKMFASM